MNGFKQLREQWSDPLLTALTALLIFIIFVVAPLEAAGFAQAQDLGFAIAAIVIGAIVILSGSSIAIAVMVAAFGLALAAAVLRLQMPSTLDVYLKAAAWILMGLALIWVVAQAVFASGRVTYHRIMGAILLYLAIGWTFAGLFTLVGLLVSDAFAGLSATDSPALASNMLYFSFGTLTTAGSGDMTPVHPIARSLVNVEAMIGQLYPATLLARLVTLEIEGEAKR